MPETALLAFTTPLGGGIPYSTSYRTIVRTGHSVLLLMFRPTSSFFILFSPPNLRDRLADRHQTLLYVRWWPRFMKFGQTFGAPSPKFGGPKNMKFRRDFGQIRDLIANSSWNQQGYHQSENGFANNWHCRTGMLTSVYFGLQTAKNRTGVLTHPPAIVQRTGINKSVAFDRWRHWPTQRAAITLGNATHRVVVSAYRYIAITNLPIIAVFVEYLGQFLIDFNQIYRHSSVP